LCDGVDFGNRRHRIEKRGHRVSENNDGGREAKARKGNAPERMKPKRARVPHVEKSGGGEPQPAEGRNP